MEWCVVSMFAVMLFGNFPPISLIDGAFLKYFGVPLALTWFMCQKTFDGKKPYGFLKSVAIRKGDSLKSVLQEAISDYLDKNSSLL